jgi:outer membrane protein TolC
MPSRSASPPARALGASAARAAARRSRAADRPVPERDEAYGHLTLEALREYRTALQAEEGKVSYWRRILQARLDVVRAGSAAGPSDRVDLRPVLTDSRVRSGRTALVEVLPVDDIPPLPSLGELWERRVQPTDLVGCATLEADLEQAEQQLSSYRAALHDRIGGATGELIARYREQPALCLSALPLRPGRPAGPPR